MSYEDKYRRDSKKAKDLLTELPIAIKSSNVDTQAPPEWMKVMVEEKDEKEEISLENVTTLHSREKVEWIHVLHRILSLGDSTLWRLIVLVLIVVNYFQVSYACIFLRDTTNVEAYYSIIVCDLIYFVDFSLAVTIYFWRNLQLRLVNPPRNKKTLICDTFLVLPYSFIYEIIFKRKNSIGFIILRSISFFRLFHLVRFFKEKYNSAGTNHWMYFIIQYFMYFFLLQHAIACILFVLACPLDCWKPGGWSTVLTKYNRYPETKFQWYITCMYFALINLTNSGFGDLIATTGMERITAVLTMALGFTLTTGVFIGSLTSQFVNSSLRKATIRNQLVSIKKYCNVLNLPEQKVKEIMDYYYILWTKKKGIREAEDLGLLPKPLRMEICFDINFALLQCSLIFRDKPEAFLRTVALNMKHEFYQPGEIIYYQHVIKYKMVCVASGVIEILSDEDNQSPIISFTAGSVIGEAAIVLSIPARATMRAASYTEIQALYKRDYMTLNDAYPELILDIRNQIFSRIKDAARVEEIDQRKEINNLSLYVSHNRQWSEIKKLKNRLNPKTAYTFGSTDTFYRKCLPLYRLSENIKKTKTKPLCFTSNFPWIQQPKTTLTWTWEIIIVINTFLIGVLYPYYIAFERKFPKWLYALSVLLEVINTIDIYMILTTAIIEKDHIIQTFKGILNMRLRTYGFYCDVFSAFYLEIFSYLMRSNNEKWFYLLKLNKMLKMYRVVKFFNHLEESLTAKLITIRLIKYPIYLIMCPYWFGTILYLETCFEAVCQTSGWFYTKLLKDIKHRLTHPCIANVAYTSLYYALTCLSSLGYGDILPGNYKDMVIVCCGILIGIFVFGYCIAEFSATFTHNLKKKTDFQETLYCINKFMNDKRMKSDIRKRIHNFFLLQWHYNRGIGVTNTKSLFYNATWKIKQDVLIKERMEAITTVPLFYGTDVDFLQLIAAGSRIIILPPNEIVTYSGGVSRAMYIIQKGFCAEEKGSRQLNVIGPLSHFGMPSLLFEQQGLSTVRTITHVEIICIDFNLFTRAVSMFPTIGDELQSVVSHQDLKNQLEELKLVTHSNKEFNLGFSKIKKRKYVKKEIKGSFINVHRYCKRRNQQYNKPFNKLGNFFWLRYFLFPVCILPTGMFLKIWVIFRLIVACVVCLLTPLQFLHSPYFPNLDKIAYSFDYIAYLDLYILLHVGYYGSKKQLIIHPYKTAAHYLQGLFLIDVFLCFPWELLVSWLVPDHNEGHSVFSHILNSHQHHCLFRAPRLFQIYRLPLAFKYFESDITRKGDIIQIIKFIPTTIMFINIWASIIVVTSCKYYFKFDTTLRNVKPPSAYYMLCEKQSWLERSKYRNYTNPLDVYTTAIYWVTSTLVGSGFGDVTAQSRTHLITILFMIIFGILFFGYIYASISSHKASLHTTLSSYQEMLSELTSYLQYEKVNFHIQKQITDYYEYRWKRNSGAEINVILANVHNALLEDAVLFMYEETLREIPLFENVERSFFRVLGKELRERYYIRDFTIIRADDVVQNMFIIYRGQVEVISSYNEMQTYMGIGGLFGNITPQFKSKSSITITTKRNVDALFIKTETFYSILTRYPAVRKKFDLILETATDYIMPTTIVNEDTVSQESLNIMDNDDFSFSSTVGKSTIRSVSTVATTGTTLLGTKRTMIAVLMPHKWCRIAISPDALIFKIYSYLVAFTVYVNSLVTTFQFAFQYHTIGMFILVAIMDFIFIIKIFLEMHKAHIDRYGEFIVDNKKILRLYFKKKKSRTIDFITNVPFYYFTFFLLLFTTVDVFLVFSSVRLITLLRGYYVAEFYKSRTNKLVVNALNLKIAIIIVLISFIVHCLACGWYLYACPLTYCTTSSWLTKIPNYKRRNKFSIYILCFYKIMNVLTTTGTGDILPNTRWEISYLIIIMIMTKFCIGIFIGDVTSVLNSYTSSLVNYEYGIAELKDYLQNANVSDHQMEKMWHYVRQLWTRNRGKQLPRLIKQLPYVMQYDIMNEIYGQHLRNSFIFANTEESFIRQLSAMVHYVVFFPGNYIVQHGDSDQCMYFIHRGEVDILTVHSNLTETVHDVLHTGEMFGIAQGLFYGVPHHFSFRAKTTVDIISLKLCKLQELLKFFPNTKEMVYQKENNWNSVEVDPEKFHTVYQKILFYSQNLEM